MAESRARPKGLPLASKSLRLSALALSLALLACGPSNLERKAFLPPPAAAPAAAAGDSSAPSPSAQNHAPMDTKVFLRLHNRSDSLALEEVTVRLPHDSAHFAFIRPGGYSTYFAVDSAYRYAFIQAKSGGKEYFCQPIDFTGETPLAPGRYTYDLTPVKNRDPEAKVGFFLLELIDENGHP